MITTTEERQQISEWGEEWLRVTDDVAFYDAEGFCLVFISKKKRNDQKLLPWYLAYNNVPSINSKRILSATFASDLC